MGYGFIKLIEATMDENNNQSTDMPTDSKSKDLFCHVTSFDLTKRHESATKFRPRFIEGQRLLFDVTQNPETSEFEAINVRPNETRRSFLEAYGFTRDPAKNDPSKDR